MHFPYSMKTVQAVLIFSGWIYIPVWGKLGYWQKGTVKRADEISAWEEEFEKL